MRQRLLAGRLVIANAPQLDVNALREVLLAMDTETRDARALCETKADKKVVVYRHEMDEWIDRRCMALLQPVIDDLQRYKEQTDPRVAKVRPHAPRKKKNGLPRAPPVPSVRLSGGGVCAAGGRDPAAASVAGGRARPAEAAPAEDRRPLGAAAAG